LDEFTYDDDDDRFINSVRTVHLPTIRIMYAHRSTDYVSVIDGGADTMVLGNGWSFIEYYTDRTINIVGFDEIEAREYGCPLGTEVSVIKDVTGTEYLMVAHEAVQNERSSTSLLSEGRMRHFGLIVDSTSRQYRGIDGLPGTQSIYAPDKSIQFQMIQRDDLMVLPHRAPSEYKIAHSPRFIMTDVTP
jgi:hypothetical protein